MNTMLDYGLCYANPLIFVSSFFAIPQQTYRKITLFSYHLHHGDNPGNTRRN